MAKRTKPDLIARWSKKHNDMLYEYQGDQGKANGGMLHYVIHHLIIDPEVGLTLRQELEDRGYDITTFSMSIRRKAK